MKVSLSLCPWYRRTCRDSARHLASRFSLADYLLTHCADALRISMYGDPVGALWRTGVLVGLASMFAAMCLRAVHTTLLIRTTG